MGGAPHDFAVSWLKFTLGFLGMTEVEVVDAAGMSSDAEATMKVAEEAVSTTAAALLARAA